MNNNKLNLTNGSFWLKRLIAIFDATLAAIFFAIVLPFLRKNYSPIWLNWIILISLIIIFIFLTFFLFKKSRITIHDLLFSYSLFLYFVIISVLIIFGVSTVLWYFTSVTLLIFLTVFFIINGILRNEKISKFLYKVLCVTSTILSFVLLIFLLFENNFFNIRFLGNRMIFIKSGEFIFNGKKVMVDDFYMGRYEVTVAEYRKFIEANNNDRSLFPQWKLEEVTDNYYDNFIGDNQPIVGITWEQANKYCEWLGEKKGKNYSLPTEIQWIYAARAGGTGVFGLGQDNKEITTDNLQKFSWFGNEANTTSPVGTKSPNGKGFYDTWGNGEEWCKDLAENGFNITKGGNYEDPIIYCHTDSGQSYPPGELSRTITFRIAKNINY